MNYDDFIKLTERLTNASKYLESLSPQEQERQRKFQELIEQYKANNFGSLKGLVKYLLENHSELFDPKTEQVEALSTNVNREFVDVKITAKYKNAFLEKKARPFILRKFIKEGQTSLPIILNELYHDLQEKNGADEVRAFNFIALLSPTLFGFAGGSKNFRKATSHDLVVFDKAVNEFVDNSNPTPLMDFLGINAKKNNEAEEAHRNTKRDKNHISYGINYLPMNRDIKATQKISKERKLIFKFKNGDFQEEHIILLNSLLAPTLYTKVGLCFRFNKPCIILPIPASTKSKQQNRYNKFLIEFCQNKKNLINGFELVQILFDRPAKHISETRESKVNYKIDLKSISKLGNVDIIVFDDLVTQGSTISQFLNELGDHKDKVKQIITLGATV